MSKMFRNDILAQGHNSAATQNAYLLPGVEFKGGDANIFNLIFTGSKQQVPIWSGWQRYLGKQVCKPLKATV